MNILYYFTPHKRNRVKTSVEFFYTTYYGKQTRFEWHRRPSIPVCKTSVKIQINSHRIPNVSSRIWSIGPRSYPVHFLRLRSFDVRSPLIFGRFIFKTTRAWLWRAALQRTERNSGLELSGKIKIKSCFARRKSQSNKQNNRSNDTRSFGHSRPIIVVRAVKYVTAAN